jgi:heptosyltransferase-2
LVTTPLLKGLRLAFPESKISIGIGDWAKPLLQNNPFIDEVISCNAPWHNKQNCRFPANSIKTFLEGLLFVLISSETRFISKNKFSSGIDILGSRQGSWLLKRAGIPNRYGIKGYAGGDNWCKNCVIFKEDRNVALTALSFLSLLGSNIEIEPRPIIYLTNEELVNATARWRNVANKTKKIVIAPGGGFPEKCWGDEKYNHLINLLSQDISFSITVIGSKDDYSRVASYESKQFQNLCGKLSLRQSAAMVSQSDFVVCNSSLAMHLAGAFKVPSLTLLGDWYASAKLHQKQWGYPEGIVYGQEINERINFSSSSQEIFQLFKRLVQ